MKKSILVLFLVLIVRIGYACDCKEFSKDVEFDRSNNIFIGEIISITENYIGVKVIENFKGNLTDVVLFNQSSCSISPELAEKWLIYTKGDKELEVTMCEWSRDLKHPENSIHYLPVVFIDGNCREEIIRLNKKNASLELSLDLKNLREWKEINQQQTFLIKNKSVLIALIITFLLFLSIFLIIKNRQLKNRI
jgi:hypothetical protein